MFAAGNRQGPPLRSAIIRAGRERRNLHRKPRLPAPSTPATGEPEPVRKQLMLIRRRARPRDPRRAFEGIVHVRRVRGKRAPPGADANIPDSSSAATEAPAGNRPERGIARRADGFHNGFFSKRLACARRSDVPKSGDQDSPKNQRSSPTDPGFIDAFHTQTRHPIGDHRPSFDILWRIRYRRQPAFFSWPNTRGRQHRRR